MDNIISDLEVHMGKDCWQLLGVGKVPYNSAGSTGHGLLSTEFPKSRARSQRRFGARELQPLEVELEPNQRKGLSKRRGVYL